MNIKDINIIYKVIGLNNRTSWEQTRILSHNIIAPHLKKEIDIKKFMPFDWDNENNKIIQKETTKEDLERIKNFYKNIKKETTINE